MIKKFLLIAGISCISFYSSAQESKTYAEKLGWPKGAKVLILHVDDAGMSHDSNDGVEQATSNGVATSTSVMMPCPWVPEIVAYIKDHPNLDAGLHLTLTSEWKNYRWGPLAGKSNVPGLVDKQGCLYAGVASVYLNATADEVDKEIRAQLDRALAMGFKPTHLDSHMGTLFAKDAFLEKYIKLGIEKQIPVMFPGGDDLFYRSEAKAATIAELKKQGKYTEGMNIPDDPALAKAKELGNVFWMICTIPAMIGKCRISSIKPTMKSGNGTPTIISKVSAGLVPGLPW